ncbi:hypothetical protein [Pseudoalteromonas sp. OOF1S-7]|uniref:hypothetical protein n=1 Tax=Pseudoalteromonas sp. OOF1S-7 TaxID=2917757 RepID=UPI001EF4EAED|nr:hypothetical protein [Pseudoalteromonas sp. OOF1S-7]MCG7534230.1 hypothetical protein [Pseudoalteromonas sp. OOF1S-7]
MTPVNTLTRCMLPVCITACTVAAHPLSANNIIMQQQGNSYHTITVQCEHDPLALGRMLDYLHALSIDVTVEFSGQCMGPILITRDGITLTGQDRQTASVKLSIADEHHSAVHVQSAVSTLSNFTIDTPDTALALHVEANATVTIDGLTTSHVFDPKAPYYPFTVHNNSTVYVKNHKGLQLKVSGSSAADLMEGNRQVALNVTDTSTARSTSSNQFDEVEVSGNGYFLGDNQSSIKLLKIWSKGAAEINNQSSVKEIMMGGQTLFAAYRQSSITGPYRLWGNVVFELEHSIATGWQSVDKPHSIISGHNATVNGIFYPDWDWRGQ